jgi:hypothetical protein
MSTPRKPDDARGWLFIEKLTAEEEAQKEMERLEKMSEEDLAAEMGARGGDAARVPGAEELLAGAEARARAKDAGAAKPEGTTARSEGTTGARSGASVVPLRRRPMWTISLIAAALGVLVYVLGTGGGTGGGVQRAEGLRKDGFAACDAKRWDDCESKLDAARGVDPEGERDARVVAARKAIARARQSGGDR